MIDLPPAQAAPRIASQPNPMPISLYIHFPFCLRKCLYCDFNSVADSRVSPEEYVTALVREMELRAATLTVPVTAATLYFGGGTPSLMEPAQVGRVIEVAARLYGLAADAEITIEANPGTLTFGKLAGYRAAGVNRLSLGVQSFDDRLLACLGRVHTAEEALSAYGAARESGFANIGIDLIHSLPGQSPAMWRDALRQAVELGPEHISAYGLTVEEGTPFALLEARGELPLPVEDESAGMFEATAEILQDNGYEQYEISNFARPGFRSRHNQVYWRRGTYLGFGAGAHSFLHEPSAGVRWKNPDALPPYLETVLCDVLPEEDRQLLSRREALSEAFFLGLRLLEGVDLRLLTGEFGPAVEECFAVTIRELTDQGLLLSAAGRLRLSPRAIIVANHVFSRFL
jgi:oxygen-independent coproporphyrinogen-3 oxidase